MLGRSDQKLKDRLKVRLDVMRFAERDLHGDRPDATTDIRFRTAIVAAGAYPSTANRAAIQGKHRHGILRKAARGRPLRGSKKRFNKLLAKRRFHIEHVFGAGKSLFGRDRARYLAARKRTPKGP